MIRHHLLQSSQPIRCEIAEKHLSEKSNSTVFVKKNFKHQVSSRLNLFKPGFSLDSKGKAIFTLHLTIIDQQVQPFPKQVHGI